MRMAMMAFHARAKSILGETAKSFFLFGTAQENHPLGAKAIMKAQ